MGIKREKFESRAPPRESYATRIFVTHTPSSASREYYLYLYSTIEGEREREWERWRLLCCPRGDNPIPSSDVVVVVVVERIFFNSRSYKRDCVLALLRCLDTFSVYKLEKIFRSTVCWVCVESSDWPEDSRIYRWSWVRGDWGAKDVRCLWPLELGVLCFQEFLCQRKLLC